MRSSTTLLIILANALRTKGFTHENQHGKLSVRLATRARQQHTLLFNEKQNETDESSDSGATSLLREYLASMTNLRDDTGSSSAQFGDVVRLKRPSTSADEAKPSFFESPSENSENSSSVWQASVPSVALEPTQIRRRNLGVAILSIALAVCNYGWQYLHPVTPIQILYQMEQQSSPVTVIGNTNKPTVIDFWAPWCENCKMLAPTLLQIEEEFGKDVNFVMVNGDQPSAWPLIEAFGVDAIPHLALVEADGTVDTALIGPVPKQWLEKDLQVLVDNAKLMDPAAGTSGGEMIPKRSSLPYQMLDVFANRPDQRRVQIETTSPE